MIRIVSLALATIFIHVTPLVAQSLSLTPRLGVEYADGSHPAALGLSVDISLPLSPFGARLEGTRVFGDAPLSAASLSAMFHPIPRLLVVGPYAGVGAGIVREGAADPTFAPHGTVGVLLSLGRFGIDLSGSAYGVKNEEDAIGLRTTVLLGIRYGLGLIP